VDHVVYWDVLTLLRFSIEPSCQGWLLTIVDESSGLDILDVEHHRVE
jgi:hypothetical protein